MFFHKTKTRSTVGETCQVSAPTGDLWGELRTALAGLPPVGMMPAVRGFANLEQRILAGESIDALRNEMDLAENLQRIQKHG